MNSITTHPQITQISPISGPVGTTVTILDSGFCILNSVFIDFGTTQTITTTTSSQSGTFSATFIIDSQTLGIKTITVTFDSLLLASNFLLLPSYGTISGRVLDIVTNKPISGATVTTDSTITTTDKDGYYTLVITPTVSVTSSDYYQAAKTVSIGTGNITSKDFSLCPKKLNIPADTWMMFSLPVLSDAIALDKLFETAPDKFKICRWDPQAEDLGEPQMRYRVVDTIEPNKGYWLKVYGEQATITSKGESQEALVPITLYPGWNMIGCPFIKPATIDSTATLWTWTGTEYTTTTQLIPWQGYWVKAETETTIKCRIQNSEFRIQNLEKELSWKIKLYATSGKYKNSYNILGVAKEANIGIDRFDLSKPPAMEGLYCSFDGGLAKDIREEGQDSYTWNLNIQSQSPTTLSWVIEGVPEDYEIWLIDGDKAIDMRKNTEFRIQNSELKIKVMKPEAGLVIEKLEITGVISYPNPSSGEVTFRANLLTSGAGLSAKLYNILGQIVREHDLTPTQGKSWARFDKNTQSYIYESGYSCQNNSNQRLANGLYFFQITASENGKQTSKIGKMVISR